MACRSKSASGLGTVKVTVRSTSAAKRRYRSLRKLTLKARATVTDGAGAKDVATRRILLER